MKTKSKAKIIYFILGIFLAFAIFFIFYTVFFKNPGYSFFYSIGKFAGLLGFIFLSFLIFSGETARFFDRFFGINKIILFQRKFSLITAFFVLTHPFFFIISDKNFINYFVLNFVSLSLALGVISFYIFVIVLLSSILYKKISYKIWQYIHIFIYLLFFFSFYHAVRLGSDSNFLVIKLIYYLAFVSVIVGIIYRTNYKIKERSNIFYVKEIKKETEDAFTLVVNSNKPFSFKAGQFCFLRLDKSKIYARHPFTISSSSNNKELCFTMKVYGEFTRAVLKLKKGERIFVDGPFGIFTFEDTISDLKKKVVFVAGGVGITPFFSMINSNKKAKEKKNITLFYCSKKIKNIIFKNKLNRIKNKWFKKIYIVSQDKCSGNVKESGRIDKRLIQIYFLDIKNSVFYICGPEKMKEYLVNELKRMGVEKSEIITEDFFW